MTLLGFKVIKIYLWRVPTAGNERKIKMIMAVGDLVDDYMYLIYKKTETDADSWSIKNEETSINLIPTDHKEIKTEESDHDSTSSDSDVKDDYNNY